MSTFLFEITDFIEQYKISNATLIAKTKIKITKIFSKQSVYKSS